MADRRGKDNKPVYFNETQLQAAARENSMTIFSELADDFRSIFKYRKEHMDVQKELDSKAPRAGDLAPDFTLTDVSGERTVTLSDFRGEKPVALVFGSFT
jgi:hypothetical protein